jgi:hypothetical protein
VRQAAWLHPGASVTRGSCVTRGAGRGARAQICNESWASSFGGAVIGFPLWLTSFVWPRPGA